MKYQTSGSNKHEAPQVKLTFMTGERQVKYGVTTEWLEAQIDARAHEISQRRSGHDGRSLASWLQAAREILSEDSENGHPS